MRARAGARLHALLSCAHAAAERNDGRKDASARNGPGEVTTLINVQGKTEPWGLAAAAATLLSITSHKQQQQRQHKQVQNSIPAACFPQLIFFLSFLQTTNEMHLTNTVTVGLHQWWWKKTVFSVISFLIWIVRDEGLKTRNFYFYTNGG